MSDTHSHVADSYLRAIGATAPVPGASSSPSLGMPSAPALGASSSPALGTSSSAASRRLLPSPPRLPRPPSPCRRPSRASTSIPLTLFLNKDKYSQYGLWERYVDLYPEDDLVFTVGESDPSKDWFFAHVTRKVGSNIVATTRHIRFNLDHVVPDGVYTLRISHAAAHMSILQVHVNGDARRGGVFTSPEFGDSNAIARHGIHGVQWDLEFPVKGYLLNEGENNITITQTRAFSIFVGVMYDYVLLEGPAGSWRDPTRRA